MKRPIVIVLGMHRSGTSLCSSILSTLGFDMADDLRANDSNPRGHWERWEIVGYHDRILALFDRDYYSPNHALALPPDWWTDPRVRAIRDELVAWLRKRMGDRSRFGFKDPRTCRMLPLWHEVVAELGLDPFYVMCVRDPRHIVRSIARRDGFDREDTEYRYVTYYAHAIAGIGTAPVAAIPYDSWFDDRAANLARLTRGLDLAWDRDDPNSREALDAIIEPGLRHDPVSPEPPVASGTGALYRLMLEAVAQQRFGDELRAVAAAILGMEVLSAPVQRAAERWRAHGKEIQESAAPGNAPEIPRG